MTLLLDYQVVNEVLKEGVQYFEKHQHLVVVLNVLVDRDRQLDAQSAKGTLERRECIVAELPPEFILNECLENEVFLLFEGAVMQSELLVQGGVLANRGTLSQVDHDLLHTGIEVPPNQILEVTYLGVQAGQGVFAGD